MPLLDHFHAPLNLRRQWHSFHHAWAALIAVELNRKLPAGYFADPNVAFGIEIDVATFEETPDASPEMHWNPLAPTMVAPMAMLTDVVEVNVFSSQEGPVLIGAFELISSANKDQASARDAFVSKCASLLQQGIGLVAVDVVTNRRADIFAELMQRIAQRGVVPSDLWTASYRPVSADGDTDLQIWHEPIIVGGALPTLPFWLKGGLCLRFDFEASYIRTLCDQRIQDNGTIQNGATA